MIHHPRDGLYACLPSMLATSKFGYLFFLRWDIRESHEAFIAAEMPKVIEIRVLSWESRSHRRRVRHLRGQRDVEKSRCAAPASRRGLRLGPVLPVIWEEPVYREDVTHGVDETWGLTIRARHLLIDRKCPSSAHRSSFPRRPSPDPSFCGHISIVRR